MKTQIPITFYNFYLQYTELSGRKQIRTLECYRPAPN